MTLATFCRSLLNLQCFGTLSKSSCDSAASAESASLGANCSNSHNDDDAKRSSLDATDSTLPASFKSKHRGIPPVPNARAASLVGPANHTIAVAATDEALQCHDKDSAFLPVLRLEDAAQEQENGALLPADSSQLLAAPSVASCVRHQRQADASWQVCQGSTPRPATISLLDMRSQVCQLQLLGRGGQAVVFRGVWQLADVAVKLVVANPASTPASTLARLLLEGPLSKRLRAPNVMETYSYSVTRLSAEDFVACHAADESRGCTGSSSRNGSMRNSLCICEPDEKLLEFLNEHDQQAQRHQQQPLQWSRWPRGSCEGRGAGPYGAAAAAEDSAAAAAAALAASHRSFDSLDGFGPSPISLRRSSAASVLSYSEALSAAGAAPGCYLTQIIMELCDQGSLADALAKGAYAKAAYDRAALFAYLRTLHDIAAGMSYLHSNGVIHGDLKPGNVLLRSSRADPRGYQAKVADFGLAHCVGAADRQEQTDPGAAGSGGGGGANRPAAEADWSSHPYMAPEHFDGCLVMGSDVWSFAATAHHMWTGALPHAGLHPLQVCAGVCDGSLRLEAPNGMPRPLWGLLRACMAQEAGRRPAFPRIRGALKRMEAEWFGA